MATLVFKFLTLTVKTVSKPLAGQFEKYVMGHPVLRSQVIAIAQRLHRLDVSITRGAEGKTGRAFVGDMSEERAVQLASKVVSEGFVYTTAVALLLLEMIRKNKEDEEKKEKAAVESARINSLHDGHLKAEKALRNEQDSIKEILRRLEDRLMMIEEQVMDIRKAQAQSRRWLPNIF